MSKRIVLLVLLLLGVLALAMPQQSMAATAACTSIGNTATLDYSVGGVAQAQLSTGATATFIVGNKVNVLVAATDATYVSASSGSTGYLLNFTITNNGNAVQKYALTAVAKSGTTGAVFSSASTTVTDTFDMTNVEIRNGTNTATIASTASVAPGASIAVKIRSDVPLGTANGSIAAYALRATTQYLDGTVVTAGTATATAYDGSTSCVADVVFADAGDPDDASSGSPARDGSHAARSAYQVTSAQISIGKTYSVITDGLGGTSPIPGATVRYSITIANAGGGVSAVLTTISDALAGTLMINSGSGVATWAVPASTRATKSGTLTADTGDGDTDGLGHSNTAAVGGTVTATLTTILAGGGGYTAGELKPGETLTLTFDATIQ